MQPGGGSGGAMAQPGDVSISPSAGIWTSVRGQANPPVLSFQVENPGAADVTVNTIEVSGDSELFTITQAPDLPATIAGGEQMSVSVQLVTAENILPNAPAQDSGSTIAAGALEVSAGGEPTQAELWGVILTQANWEPTFGQILDVLGYDVDIGNTLRTNANPDTLPGVDNGTDEIAAPVFVRASDGEVGLMPVARFSPEGVMPFGFYTPGDSNARTEVGAMDAQTDAHTSNKARMVLPPVTGGTTFDPGTASFGIWAFTNQVAEGNTQHGDYLYSEDSLNITGSPHRVKVYPLKDSAGMVVENSYLLGCEEAANGDYQDYVFVLSNVTPAP